MKLTQRQYEILNDKTRFKTVCAGRRWGKTYLAIIWLLLNAYKSKSKCWFVSPSYRMSKQIAWQILKDLIYENSEYLKKTNETSLEITLTNGSVISLKGADNYDSLRGTGINYVVLDEFAFMQKEVWTEVIRPSLTDTNGIAMFIGTPDGLNYFYEIYQKEKTNSDYKSWTFKTIDSPFIDNLEVEKARAELDERTFRQEYEASFETALGLVYYNFSKDNIKEIKSNLNYPILLSFDFNFSEAPMTTSISQIIADKLFVYEAVNNNLDLHSHCQILKDKLKNYDYNNEIIIYGDATKVHSIESNATNWQIVKQYFPNAIYKVPTQNPAIIDRINSVCSMIKSNNGIIRMFVNNNNCTGLIDDFNQLVWKATRREVDATDKKRTHNSDNIGYLIWQEFPLRHKIKTTLELR